MAWTDWNEGNHPEFPGYLVKINTDENPWIHYLVAPLDEPEPERNHIHLKARIANKGEATKKGVEWGVVEDAYLVHLDNALVNRGAKVHGKEKRGGHSNVATFH